MKKSWIAAASLSVIAAVAIAVPAVRGLAIESPMEKQPADCAAVTGEVTGTATDLQSNLTAVPPKLDGVAELVNGLLDPVLNLINTGCLPKPELPVAAPAQHQEQLLPLPTLVPLPSASVLPPIGGALPTVPVCTDLTADLLDAVSSLLAALLSTGLPDITAALGALTDLLDTLTKLTDATNNCLPAAPVANR